jgi:hypothetical protein
MTTGDDGVRESGDSNGGVEFDLRSAEEVAF